MSKIDITQETLIMTQQQKPPETVSARCPSCGKQTVFTFIGVQNWPPRLVQMANISPTTTLWRCENCLTTISDVDMQQR